MQDKANPEPTKKQILIAQLIYILAIIICLVLIRYNPLFSAFF